jgi:adenosylcobinamide amidohydrolase
MAFGVDRAKTAIKKNLGYKNSEFTTLMTGADMDNLSIQKRSYKDVEVTALVTAGVRGNALRASRDSGSYYGHGTINIIILTNHRLTPNAMLRAIITATEAKTAALLDMDIRSTYIPVDYRATGTGTDNILVVRGDGPPEKYTGGHTKSGELIAKAVHAGVTEAIYKQNGIRPRRDIRQRLRERGLKPDEIAGMYFSGENSKKVSNELEQILSLPFYSSFIETAFTISDEYEKGLISDPTPFEAMCADVINRISHSDDISLENIPETDHMTTVLSKAFGSLIYGITLKDKKGKQ